MKATLEQVVNEAWGLSPQDRWKLVARLIHELEPKDDLSKGEIEKAWDQEVSRRLEEIDSGKVKAVPAEEVFARIQKRLAEAS
jgi:putative addiction module component (TIGR02574 family)